MSNLSFPRRKTTTNSLRVNSQVTPGKWMHRVVVVPEESREEQESPDDPVRSDALADPELLAFLAIRDLRGLSLT